MKKVYHIHYTQSFI